VSQVSRTGWAMMSTQKMCVLPGVARQVFRFSQIGWMTFRISSSWASNHTTSRPRPRKRKAALRKSSPANESQAPGAHGDFG
jgi:hypothetical protein